MKFRLILFFILGFFIFNTLTYTHAIPKDVDFDEDEMADSTRKNNPDSTRKSRLHIADSLQEARERTTDSVKYARKKKADSIQAKRKHITDSTAAIRKYHDSKKYKDSVTRSRTLKTNSLKKSRQTHMDSLKDKRKSVTDSMTSVRKTKTDSITSIQKRRTDSLGRVKKYKTSKRYADSVIIAKHVRSDSIKAAQKTRQDKIAASRKYSLDSAKKIRMHNMDSVKTVRNKHLDSIKTVRKGKTDSLARSKKLKEDLAKSKDKKKDEDKKLKLELKIKQKHKEWSNTSMLKKRWGPIRRVTQNSFTHYNYYYNANKKMEEAEINMQRNRKENYDSLLGLYPFNPSRDSSLMSADMDTIVRKISVGIQIHDPRVKWANDLYLLLGEAYYYRGQYENASIAFRYIISKDEEAKKAAAKKGYGSSKSKEAPSILQEDQHNGLLDFLKHKSVHNEAILWLAHTYTQAEQVENAESILSLLESDAKLPEELKGRLAIEKAFAFLAEHNYEAVVEQLAVAVDDEYLPDWLRMRAAFIQGQLLQNLGDHKDAAISFEKVLTYYPKIEMDFYARKYVAFNKLQSGEDIEQSMRPLKKVLNDGKYISYYDQVYFVLGKLAVKANQNKQAITYFTKSTTTPKATKKQKAISFAALGDVYYATSEYSEAKRSYDSASKYSSSVSKDANIATALQRSKGLEDVSLPGKIIHDQDSLLELSKLSKKEQLSVVRKYLRDLEKKRIDSAINAESTGVTAAAPVDVDESSKDAANWYFGNTALMQQGSNDFKRKWGNRPLTDNWRRGSALTFTSNTASAEDDQDDLLTASGDNGLPTEEGLLARIPNTSQQKEAALKLEYKAYIQLAKAYVKQLEDYNMATKTLDTLDNRFPDHNQKEEELYLRYRIAIKQNKLDKAKQYSEQLLAKFPNSQYAAIVKPKNSESKLDDMIAGKTLPAYFDETYQLLMQHQYTEVLMRTRAANKQYDNPTYQKRFEIIDAMAYAGSNDFNQADTIISKFIRSNPPTDSLMPWANSVKNYIKEVRNGGKPSWYKEGPYVYKDTSAKKNDVATITPPPTPKLSQPSEPIPPSDIPSSFIVSIDTEHYCILVLPGVDSRTSGLKKAVAALNNEKYIANGLEILFDLYNIDLGVLVVRKFKNAADAKTYLGDLLATEAFKGYGAGEIKTMLISGPNYKKMFADKNTQLYSGFYNANYK